MDDAELGKAIEQSLQSLLGKYLIDIVRLETLLADAKKEINELKAGLSKGKTK